MLPTSKVLHRSPRRGDTTPSRLPAPSGSSHRHAGAAQPIPAQKVHREPAYLVAEAGERFRIAKSGEARQWKGREIEDAGCRAPAAHDERRLKRVKPGKAHHSGRKSAVTWSSSVASTIRKLVRTALRTLSS